MRVIPAIDIKDGRCVRLLQGKKEAVTVYSDDPVAIALKWESYGARLIHIVDLDGAFTGNQSNLDSIISIRNAVKIDIQVGGGIRDSERIEQLLSAGVNRVILGTAAIENPQFVKEACDKYSGQIFVGIDAKNGFVAAKGWVEVTQVKAIGLALKMRDYNVAGIIYTDILRDGMLRGPDIGAIEEMVDSVNIPVIASGGVSSIDDIKNLMRIKNLWGVIVGKALYEGTLDLREAIKTVMRNE